MYFHFLFILQLFDAVRVPERVESVFAGGEIGGDVADHECFAVSGQGVFEHLSQFAPAERFVAFRHVQRPDAFF